MSADNQPIPAPAGSEVRDPRRARRRGELIVPLDEDGDQQQDHGYYDPDGPDGPEPSRRVPLVKITDPSSGIGYKMAVVAAEPPKPKTGAELMQSVEAAWSAKLAIAETRIRRLIRWLWGLSLVPVAAFAYYLVGTLVMGWTFFGAPPMTETEAHCIEAFQKSEKYGGGSGSWVDGMKDPEADILFDCLVEDKERREGSN